jgi:hypothetical protein
LAWARRLDDELVWAIEDCRHVFSGLERFLLRSGERVVCVAPKLMAGARKSARDFGKSDPLEADAVARAAVREGIESLPQARLSLDPSARSPCCSTTATQVCICREHVRRCSELSRSASLSASFGRWSKHRRRSFWPCQDATRSPPPSCSPRWPALIASAPI